MLSGFPASAMKNDEETIGSPRQTLKLTEWCPNTEITHVLFITQK